MQALTVSMHISLSSFMWKIMYLYFLLFLISVYALWISSDTFTPEACVERKKKSITYNLKVIQPTKNITAGGGKLE